MKKIIKVIFMCIIIAAIIIISTLGFKVGLKYSENTQITVNIGKEFNISDIRSITNEVFPKQSIIIQQVEIYKDLVQITVASASDEQIESLNSKINEKYELTNTVSDNIVVTQNANTRLRTIIKPYIIPTAISFGIVLVYEIIRFRKLGIWNVVYKSILPMIFIQLLLFSIYAICRIPVNRATILISLALYITSAYDTFKKLIDNNEKIKEEVIA